MRRCVLRPSSDRRTGVVIAWILLDLAPAVLATKVPRDSQRTGICALGGIDAA
jgi:hypothetical protein